MWGDRLRRVDGDELPLFFRWGLDVKTSLWYSFAMLVVVVTAKILMCKKPDFAELGFFYGRDL